VFVKDVRGDESVCSEGSGLWSDFRTYDIDISRTASVLGNDGAAGNVPNFELLNNRGRVHRY
jgi:hypothetical protein